MSYTLQQLSDFEDIRTLKHRYFRAIDTADIPLLAGLLTEDVELDYRGGVYRVKFSGRENALEFMANTFHEGMVAMHHGHGPEITLTGEDSAEGIWYLEDIAIIFATRTHTVGSAIYRDVYRREDGKWKIARSEYDRVFSYAQPFPDDAQLLTHHLAQAGRKMADLTDISHMITLGDAA